MNEPPSMVRRKLLASLGAISPLGIAGLGLLPAPESLAQDSRPLKIIVGYPPGGGTDVLARVLGEPLGKALGRTVAVLNVPGAGGQIGARSKSPRWPEAPTLTAALAPFGVAPPSADFMSRFGVYVVASAFKNANPVGYARLQQLLLQSRTSPEFQDYLARNRLQDLSIGKPGEGLDAAFATDMVEIAKIK